MQAEAEKRVSTVSSATGYSQASIYSRAQSVASSMLSERDVFVLTSLESYYPEKPKPAVKDKKGPKEFATNIDQPKDPKAIKIKVSFDRATNEITKELKSKLRVIMNPRGAMTQRGRTSVLPNMSGSGFLSARGG